MDKNMMHRADLHLWNMKVLCIVTFLTFRVTSWQSLTQMGILW